MSKTFAKANHPLLTVMLQCETPDVTVGRIRNANGCCMALCVYEHDSLSTKPQPLLHTMKLIHNEIDF